MSRDARASDAEVIDAIKRAVCRERVVSILEMDSHRREPRVVEARWLAIYLARCFTRASLPAIGRAFGDRDHSTVLHAVRRTEAHYDGRLTPAQLLQSLGITLS